MYLNPAGGNHWITSQRPGAYPDQSEQQLFGPPFTYTLNKGEWALLSCGVCVCTNIVCLSLDETEYEYSGSEEEEEENDSGEPR